MKKYLKNMRNFWWRGFWNFAGNYRTNLYAFKKIQYHRNDQEYELKKRIENQLHLERFGYKVYSQNDEDGIIDEIFRRIGTTNKRFVEFGVEDGLECNTHFLLHLGWQGLWIEGSEKHCKKIQSSFKVPLENKKLYVVNAFITKDNINQLIVNGGNISGEIDLLTIDIDGNDYWVWEEIKCIQPRVVVIEYNAKFPPAYEWVMKYDEKHIWTDDDEQGASLKSLEVLGSLLGYQLVGTNLIGINAFFVRKELAKDLFVTPATAEILYNPTRWTMEYISGHPSKKYIGK